MFGSSWVARGRAESGGNTSSADAAPKSHIASAAFPSAPRSCCNKWGQWGLKGFTVERLKDGGGQ